MGTGARFWGKKVGVSCVKRETWQVCKVNNEEIALVTGRKQGPSLSIVGGEVGLHTSNQQAINISLVTSAVLICKLKVRSVQYNYLTKFACVTLRVLEKRASHKKWSMVNEKQHLLFTEVFHDNMHAYI